MDEMTKIFVEMYEAYKEGKLSWEPSIKTYMELVFDNINTLKLSSFPENFFDPTCKPWDELPLDKERFFNRLETWLNPEAPSEPREKEKKAPGLPPRFSLCDVKGINYVTPVRNQGFFSGYSLFGILGAIEASYHYQKKKEIDKGKGAQGSLLSPQQLLCYLPRNLLTSPHPRNKTPERLCNHILHILDYCREWGIVPDTLYPYNPFNPLARPPEKLLPADWEAQAVKISGYKIYKSPERMKRHLLARGALIAPASTMVDFYFYNGGIYTCFYKLKVGTHCLCCVGYDDEKEAWLFKNSWGTQWGEEGFCWIKYGTHHIDDLMIGIMGFIPEDENLIMHAAVPGTREINNMENEDYL